MNSEHSYTNKSRVVKGIKLDRLLTNCGILLIFFAAVCLFLAILPSSKKAFYFILTFFLTAFAIGALVGGKKCEQANGSGKLIGDHLSFSGYFFLIIALLLIVIPFYVLIITSIKYLAEANDSEFTWIPEMGVQWDSLTSVFSDDTIGITLIGAFINTLKYYLPTTLICVFVSSLSAYAFSKLYFPGIKQVFSFLIFTMMLPGCITMTSSYILFDRIGLTSTAWPFILPGFFGSVTMIFFMREFFSGIPNELIEAAKVEGARKLNVYFTIILPLGAPAIIAQLILDFIVRYNDYLAPLIYLRWEEEYTLQLALLNYSVTSQDNSLTASACLISIAPLMAVYIILQKQILTGITMTSGLKG